MIWRVVAASEIGTSHLAVQKSCEDSCWAQADQTASGQSILSIFIADGAGSAARGGAGAELAMQAVAEFMAEQLKLAEFGLNDELAVACSMAVREKIYSHAENENLTARDFACTLLGVLCSPNETLVMQVGDGGIVVDVGNGLELPVQPMMGEYANMTHFITDEDAIQVLQTKVFQRPALCVAAFSDGLQRLALNLSTNAPHEPFFAPFFKVLSTALTDHEEQLQHALVRFLGSEAVNERTDDDKTLALAYRQS